MTKKIVMIMLLLIILSGCGDTNYHASGDISIDDHSDDHSEKVEGQIATNTDINPDIDVINDKSTNNTNNNISQSFIVDNNKYQQLLKEKNKLQEENNELISKIGELESRDNDIPVIEYNDFGLCIDGNDIPINKQKSIITIDGREYYSKELAENFLDQNKSITIKNNTVFIGEVITEKANLFDQWVIDSYGYDYEKICNDSFGNQYSNVIILGGEDYITFNLKGEFSKLKFNISPNEYISDRMGVISIKADNSIIYTSPQIDILTETIPIDLSIDKCKTLTIENIGNSSGNCIISDAIIYN